MDLLHLTGWFLSRFNHSRFCGPIKFDAYEKRVFNEAFRKMAGGLSYLKGSVQQATDELSIDVDRRKNPLYEKWQPGPEDGVNY